MPLWRLYHPDTILNTPEEKSIIASKITSMYTAVGLPAFYVVVLFWPLPATNIYIGGHPSIVSSPSHPPTAAGAAPPFVRYVASNIARKLPGPEAHQRFMKRVNDTLGTVMLEKGWDWEIHFDETERELWRISGLKAPPTGSEEERLWREENKAIPWEKL
ncbi:putative oxalocrotonate tautomerase [Lineolata rhizophorae]|uniref:Putative oxalocrotonate tautomerase n=1 Tax=Lineolata rhizophorae TaxID=578093 RepID=A0A6A6PC38_9PEZI|nr:putative oxalocrotonate tautomerase [Lineolata rhizophorae]